MSDTDRPADRKGTDRQRQERTHLQQRRCAVQGLFIEPATQEGHHTAVDMLAHHVGFYSPPHAVEFLQREAEGGRRVCSHEAESHLPVGASFAGRRDSLSVVMMEELPEFFRLRICHDSTRRTRVIAGPEREAAGNRRRNEFSPDTEVSDPKECGWE